MADKVKIDPDGIYSIGTAARLLGMSASTLRALERQGKLEATRTPGGQRRFVGSEVLRLREESIGGLPRKPGPTVSNAAAADSDAKARQAWLGQLIARSQRELPADTPAEVRLRLGADLEHAFRNFGPASPMGDVEPLLKSLVERARLQAQEAKENAKRRERKDELLEHALAHLRRGIDALSKRMVGAPASLKRRHIRATLRDQLRDLLRKRLRGDEGWDHVRELADEFIAAWYVEQTPDSRIPNTVKLLAAGATGVVGGAAAAAALDPRIRAGAAKLKDPLRSLAVDVLKHFRARPPSTSPPSNQSNQTTPPPQSGRSMGLVGGWPVYPRTPRYSRPVTPKPQEAAPGGFPASDGRAGQAAPRNSDAAPDDSAGAPSPAS